MPTKRHTTANKIASAAYHIYVVTSEIIHSITQLIVGTDNKLSPKILWRVCALSTNECHSAKLLADTAVNNEHYFNLMFGVPFVLCWSA